MNIDERMELIAANLDTLTRIRLDNDREFRERFDLISAQLSRMSEEIAQLKAMAHQDGENIRALARIAEIHERRLTRLEEPPE